MNRYTFRIHLRAKPMRTVTYHGTDEADAREIAMSALTDADKERVTQITCVAAPSPAPVIVNKPAEAA
jgi:hypothetical protein